MPQRRYQHCAAAFVISSELTEVVLFGGKMNIIKTISDTTLLRIGEFHYFYGIIYI